MRREQLFTQLRAVTQSVEGLFSICPADRLDFRPKGATRNLLDLANRFEVDLEAAFREKEAINARRRWE